VNLINLAQALRAANDTDENQKHEVDA